MYAATFSSLPFPRLSESRFAQPRLGTRHRKPIHRPVPLAPLPDVGPIQRLVLGVDDVDDIIPILPACPPAFLNNDIFRRRQVSVQRPILYPNPALETQLVVLVSAEGKELDAETRSAVLDDMLSRHLNGFKTDLRIGSEVLLDFFVQFGQTVIGLDDNVGAFRVARNAVLVG